ncbi:MAG: DUF2764 family protein [Candidatus Omnitrophota bacterium]
MNENYYYLVSSLPYIEFGIKSPISYEAFLSICRSSLSPRDMESIGSLNKDIFSYKEEPQALREWKAFEISLRNELARSRAAKRSHDPEKHIKGEHYFDPFTAHFAQWAVNQDDARDTELSIDRFRWEKLEDLEKCHYFDIDRIVVYALKLKIIERWHVIGSTDGMEILKELVDKGSR